MDKKVGKKEILLLLIIFAAASDWVLCVSETAEYTRRTGKSDGGWNGVCYL